MEHSKTHYLGKSRAVLEINDTEKLHKLLIEQRGELMVLRQTPANGVTPTKNKKAVRNAKRSIARILTRLSQLRQQKLRADN